MTKKRLLMILGAGSSVECGMPSVSAINGLMRDWAREAAAVRAEPDYYAIVWRALERHLDQGFEFDRGPPDFEKALSDLAALMLWVRPPPEGGALRALAAEGALPPAIAFPKLEKYGPYVAVKVVLAKVLDALAKHMRAQSQMLDPSAAPVSAWRALLDALHAHFDVAIYNLNYDAVALTCWPGAFTGFNEAGMFEASAVHERDWSGLFHLHGGVHFTLDGAAKDTIVWRDDLSADCADSNDRAATQASDGRDFPPTTLIAGGFKLDQLLVDPFHTYHSALARDATRADAILIGGYGFSDAHVNRALLNALRARSPRPPVLVLDRAETMTQALNDRQDRKARVLRHVLYAPGDYKPPGAQATTTPAALAARDACEVSPAHRVAIWYGGFLRAGGAIDRLARWLERGEDTLLAGRD